VCALYQSAARPLPHEGDVDVLEAVDLTPSPMFGELAVCSRICARIDASDPSAGTITFLFTDASRRRYGSEDLGMIRHLAQIVHIAMENVRMNAEMRRAVDLREDFVAIASHELRTPLSTLILQLGRLRKGLEPLADGGPNGPVASWNMVERQTNRLERLVDTLLDVARSGAETIALHRESADLGMIVSGMIERLGEQAAQVGTVMHLDEGEPVVGSWDRMRVEQIVTNLLSNTLKYAAGKPVYVRVSTSEQNGVVSVRDEGIGIAPDDLGRVFERFERGVTVQRYAGLGLGLHISRALAVAHGGTIEVTSTLGEGSTFVLTLPLVHADRTSFLPHEVH
ncbi:MAG: HAMP domain-containing sensor histidine kinase, partial [Polyangiales bacterium]